VQHWFRLFLIVRLDLSIDTSFNSNQSNSISIPINQLPIVAKSWLFRKHKYHLAASKNPIKPSHRLRQIVSHNLTGFSLVIPQFLLLNLLLGAVQDSSFSLPTAAFPFRNRWAIEWKINWNGNQNRNINFSHGSMEKEMKKQENLESNNFYVFLKVRRRIYFLLHLRGRRKTFSNASPRIPNRKLSKVSSTFRQFCI
jgi:hypothetical protein